MLSCCEMLNLSDGVLLKLNLKIWVEKDFCCFFFNSEMSLSWLLGGFMWIPCIPSLCLWFEIHGCSCCAEQSFYWMSTSEAKFLPFLTAEVRDPVSGQHTISQPQPPLPETLLPHLSRGTHVTLCWQTLDTPKYVRTYLESDVSPWSRRQNTKLKQAGLKEKNPSYFSVSYLRTSWASLSYCKWKFYGKGEEKGFPKLQRQAQWVWTQKKVLFPPSLHFSLCRHGISAAFPFVFWTPGSCSSPTMRRAMPCLRAVPAGRPKAWEAQRQRELWWQGPALLLWVCTEGKGQPWVSWPSPSSLLWQPGAHHVLSWTEILWQRSAIELWAACAGAAPGPRVPASCPQALAEMQESSP